MNKRWNALATPAAYRVLYSSGRSFMVRPRNGCGTLLHPIHKQMPHGILVIPRHARGSDLARHRLERTDQASSWTLQDQARTTAVAKSSKGERLACLEASFGAYVAMLRTKAQVGRQRPGAGYHQCGISAGYQ